jgi:hypothetical protein
LVAINQLAAPFSDSAVAKAAQGKHPTAHPRTSFQDNDRLSSPMKI